MRKLLVGFATLAALEAVALAATFMGVSNNVKASQATETKAVVESSVEDSTASVLDTPIKGSLEFYKELSDDLGLVELYDSSDLTIDDLQSRDGKLIIERVIGIVEDSEGNGRVLNLEDEEQNYINYSHVDGFEVGNVIATFCIYDPDCSAEDCVVARYDYIIDTKTCLDED